MELDDVVRTLRKEIDQFKRHIDLVFHGLVSLKLLHKITSLPFEKHALPRNQ